MSNDLGVAEILEQAANIIEERGWRGGINCPGEPDSCCAGTAINAVEGKGPNCIALPVMWKAIGGTGVSSIFVWNDAPERTASEVTSTMRALAATFRASNESRNQQRICQDDFAALSAEAERS